MKVDKTCLLQRSSVVTVAWVGSQCQQSSTDFSMSNSSQFEYAELSARYAGLSKAGLTPIDFYRHLHNDGVSKGNILLLLRDQYSLGLIECLAIAEEAEA